MVSEFGRFSLNTNHIKDNYRAIDRSTPILILVRKHLKGQYEAYIAAELDRTQLMLGNATRATHVTIEDALRDLLDRSCAWLDEDEALMAEYELRDRGRWASETSAESQDDTIISREHVEAMATSPAHTAELERRRQKNLRRIARRRRARSPATGRRVKERNGIA